MTEPHRVPLWLWIFGAFLEGAGAFFRGLTMAALALGCLYFAFWLLSFLSKDVKSLLRWRESWNLIIGCLVLGPGFYLFIVALAVIERIRRRFNY